MSLRRIKLTKLNEHLVCVLCNGYFVEATTITECLHTFCRVCIVKYLEKCSFCPVCEVQVHKTKPVCGLREDKTLQDIVFKLVPNLFHNEMRRRAQFYGEHPEAVGERTALCLKEKRHFFHVDDQISLSLEFLPPAHAHAHALGLRPLRAPSYGLSQAPEELLAAGDEPKKDADPSSPEIKKDERVRVPQKRYLKCPAASQIRLLEKFIRLKYSLSSQHRIDIVHTGDCLSPELTLLDVVYMYKWTEDEPLKLQYTVIAPPLPMRKRKRIPANKPNLTEVTASPKKSKLVEDIPCESSQIKVNEDIESLKKSEPSKSCEAKPFDCKMDTESEDKENITDNCNSLNSSRDDADDAMVIDESASGDNSDKESGNGSGSSNSEKPDSITPVTNESRAVISNVSSIESLKSLVNNSTSYTLTPKSDNNTLANNLAKVDTSFPMSSVSVSDICVSKSITNSSPCVTINRSIIAETVSSSNVTSTNAVKPNLINSSQISAGSVPSGLSKPISTSPAMTVVSSNGVHSSSSSALIPGNSINNRLPLIPGNSNINSSSPIIPGKSNINKQSASSDVSLPTTCQRPTLVPLAPKIGPCLAAPTAPTTSLRTPVLSSQLPKSTVPLSVSDMRAPVIATAPRNLISNSYRADMQLANSIRMKGMIPSQRPVFDPTKPRLGRPPKSFKNAIPTVPRLGSNVITRPMTPPNVYKPKGVKSEGGRGRPKNSTSQSGGRGAVPANNLLPTQPLMNHVSLPNHTMQLNHVLNNSKGLTTAKDVKNTVSYPQNGINQILPKSPKFPGKLSPKIAVNGIHPVNGKPQTPSQMLAKNVPGQKPLVNGSSSLVETTTSVVSTIGTKVTSVSDTTKLKMNSSLPMKPAKSPTGSKTKNGGTTPKILEIAESLVNKQLQQMSQKVSPKPSSTISAATTALTQALSTSGGLGLPGISQALNNGGALGIPGIPQAFQAAYMADYAAVHNLLSLGQAAARMNLAMNCLQDPSDKSEDSAPIDLSPTSKASVDSNSPRGSKHPRKPNSVVSTPAANNIMASSPKAAASATSQNSVPANKVQPPPSSSSSSQQSNRTISPPTPEVTITKLPNSSSETPSATTTITTSAKPFQSNTISITKRGSNTTTSSGSKFVSVTRSPSNASIRQIPNPSLLSHQSEARTNHSTAFGSKPAQPVLPSPFTNNNCNSPNMNNAVKVDL